MSNVLYAPPSDTLQAVRCRTVETLAGWQAMEPVWRSLGERCVEPSPFRSWEFASSWWRHFSAGGRRLYVIVVEEVETGAVVGIAPLHYNATASWSPVPCRMEMFGISGTLDTLLEEPLLLFERGCERSGVDAVLRHLYSGECRVAWDFLALQVTCPPGMRLLDGPPSADIARLETQWTQGEYASDMIAPLSDCGDWQQYRRLLSKSMRDNTAYYPKRLAKHGRAFTVHMVSSPAELPAATDLLIELHRKRSEDKHALIHVNHVPGPLQRALFHDLIQSFAATGGACVGVLKIDGRPAAAQAFVRRGDSLIFYFSGHEPELFQYSPLLLLAMAAIQDAIAGGCGTLNFLPGMALWKERWGAQPQSIVQTLNSTSGTPRAVRLTRARALARRLQSSLKRV